MICSKYLARFWWEYQWKTMEFQVNDAFLIAETLQVMALLVIDRISFAIRLFPSLAQHEIATSHWQMLVLVFLCFFLWVQQCCKRTAITILLQDLRFCISHFFLKSIVTSNLAQAHMGFRHENVCVLHDVYPGQKKSLKAMNCSMLQKPIVENCGQKWSKWIIGKSWVGSMTTILIYFDHSINSDLNFCGISQRAGGTCEVSYSCEHPPAVESLALPEMQCLSLPLTASYCSWSVPFSTVLLRTSPEKWLQS